MLSTLNATAALHQHIWAGGWGFGWFFLLIPLFWIGVVVLIVTLVGRRRRAVWLSGGYGYSGPDARSTAQATPTQSAERTLAERFAHGDIDEVEYRARLEVLRANRASEG